MTKPNFTNRTLWTADNLDILRGMNSDSFDLIYLDPPFNSNQDYSAPIGSVAAGAAFKDTWTLSDLDVAWMGLIADEHPAIAHILSASGVSHGKSMQSYLTMMAVRLLEMRRVLKPTGSIYLHCDPTASHYLKMLMDGVFVAGQFRGHISWRRTFAHNDRMFAATSDHLIRYSKSRTYAENGDAVRIPFDDAELAKRYPYEDSRGRYMHDNLMGPGTTQGESGNSWRGCDPTSYGRCWSAPKTGRYAQYLDQHLLPGYLAIQGVIDRLEILNRSGFIHWASTGVPQLKRYAMPSQGRMPGDIWTDISPLSRRTKERTGYPTQKPLALLERIIKASSNEGDVVLDPFCGCATACVAAENLGRQWVGDRHITKSG